MRNNNDKSTFPVTYTWGKNAKSSVPKKSTTPHEEESNSISSLEKTNSLAQLQFEKYSLCFLFKEAYLQACKRKEGDDNSQLKLTRMFNSIMGNMEFIISDLYKQIESLQGQMNALAVTSSDDATCEKKLKEELDKACKEYHETCRGFRQQFITIRIFDTNCQDNVFFLQPAVDSNAQPTTQQNAPQP